MKLTDYFRQKKSNLLLIYGYVLPFIGSLLASLVPWLLNSGYSGIASYFSDNLELLLALLAFVGAVTFPFQSSIINEENPHVLAVLSKSGVRAVFVRASIFQAVLILFFALLILLLSVVRISSEITGGIKLFALTTIVFESIGMISNGRIYSEMREKIIMAVNGANLN